ncbi:MAG TPA: ATP-binding protein [Bryobacteraceae bacterium]|nr:ATP-binding protein [Bryobacteraceae bacterium]
MEVWRHRAFVIQCILASVTLCLLALEYWTLLQMQAVQRIQREARANTVRQIPIDKVFSFPEVTCAPRLLPVFAAQSAPLPPVPQSARVTRLARDQFQYGLGLTACVFCGLLLGVALSYRAVAREARFAMIKSSFVSNVSHEMKTPLATIQMFAETLETGRVHEPAKLNEYYRVIHKESRRLGQLIEDVLDFARMENQTRCFRFETCDIGDLTEAVVAEFESQVGIAGGQLTLDIQRPLPAMTVDAKALTQAIQNLLSNALKYSPARKDIRVTVRWNESGMAISVQDRGIGIAQGEQERIFEKFYRVDTGLAHNTKGTGLGLAIAKHIVKAHGGGIFVESGEGRGSRFTILLPRKRVAPGSVDGHQQAAETVDRRG